MGDSYKLFDVGRDVTIMNDIGNQYAKKLYNIVSGYRWLQILTVYLRGKTIAVSIYIYNIIISCNHVTSVTNESIYARGTKIVFHTVLVDTLVTWLHNLSCYRKSVKWYWLHTGYSMDTRMVTHD